MKGKVTFSIPKEILDMLSRLVEGEGLVNRSIYLCQLIREAYFRKYPDEQSEDDNANADTEARAVGDQVVLTDPLSAKKRLNRTVRELVGEIARQLSTQTVPSRPARNRKAKKPL